MNLGPNMRRLIAMKMAQDAIPSGGGVNDAVKYLLTPGMVNNGWKNAKVWAFQAVDLVRKAAEPNPYKEASDEVIAGELVRLSEERKKRA